MRTLLTLVFTLAAAPLLAAGGKAVTSEKEAGADFKIQGEYAGKADGQKIGIQVIALGKGKFDAVVYFGGLPGDGWKREDRSVRLTGATKDGKTDFKGEKGQWGQVTNGVFHAHIGAVAVNADKVLRKSPTLGAQPPGGATVLFDGSGVDAWQAGKLAENRYLAVGTRTKQKFQNFRLHLEFRTPYMAEARGQGRGNSGMYLLDQYECQVLDSFGLDGKDNECGGIYKASKPIVNMCLPPLSWQTYDVDFTAAEFDGDKKVAKAVVTIRHNGVVIHDRLELPGSTPGGGQRDESKPGALFLQNHGNPVHFQNIWIVEK
ncbi:MAG: DUF1080 domain-containing protein [Planctomycetaceae bacterium]